MIALAAVWCNAWLDGVFECRYDLFEIPWQLASAFDNRPQRHGRRRDGFLGQHDVIKIVVEVGTPAAVARITSLSKPWPAILPSTRAADVFPALVRQKRISAAIQTLRMTLQPARVHGQRGQVGVIGNNEQEIDVLRIRLRCNDGPDERDPPDSGDTASGEHESTKAPEQSCPLILGIAHHPHQSRDGI